MTDEVRTLKAWRTATGGRTGRDGGKQRATVAVRFDDVTFEEVRRRGAAADISFAEQVRRLVAKGLEQ